MKRLAILLLLLATTTNAFVAQTHLHAGFAPQHQAAISANDPGTPMGGDEPGCLLCQVAAHGGAALVSSYSVVLQIGQQHTNVVPGFTSDPVSLPPTHAWLSRGPPRS